MSSNGIAVIHVSGGVDSAVVATLIHRAVGDQLSCIFVNNGLLRREEPERVLAAIAKDDAESEALDEADWERAPLGELVEHIVNNHHQYLRAELPRLAGLLAKLVRRHGQRRPELVACSERLSPLRTELEAHMQKEEQILFPMVRRLATAVRLPEFHCGRLRNPLT